MTRNKFVIALAAVLACMALLGTVAFAAQPGTLEAKTGEKARMRLEVHKLAAELLGKSEAELKEALKGGAELGELLKNAGKLEEFKTRLLAEFKAKLDQAVKEGKLTQEKANEIYQKKQQRISGWDGNGPGPMRNREGKPGGCKDCTQAAQ